MKHPINTTEAPAAVGPYSQAITANGFIYTSGQIALTPTGDLVQGSIAEEAEQAMKNLRAVLQAAAVDFGNVIKTTIYLTTFAEVNATYSEFLGEPYPARECVGVKELPLGARVEISMIAVIPSA
jgi:2-iminobutanoate/2-iminopropanoate deaminase